MNLSPLTEHQMISSLNDHLDCLYRLRRFGIQFGLETISRLLRGLGNPQTAYPCVHVAGTNGKGSIASMVASILAQGGYRVGLYTSPHLVRFNERIRINGDAISDHDAADAADAVQRVYAQSDPPTFFECATAMALYHFAKEKVQWAVLETGMGGRFDATNVVRPEVCVISNVTVEHVEYLGNTLAKIAAEKAGIIKPGVAVVTGVSQQRVLEVIEAKAAEQKAPLRTVGRDFKVRRTSHGRFTYCSRRCKWPGLQIPLLGDHQIRNAAVALGAVEFLLEKGVMLSSEAIYRGLASTHWPGRLEVVARDPLVILDGAHNPAAARVLRRFLESTFSGSPLTLVVGILADKAWKAMVRDFAAPADRVIFTRSRSERAADPESLAAFARAFHRNVAVLPNVRDAVIAAIEEGAREKPVCVTGSLYTVGEAKAYFDGQPGPGILHAYIPNR